MLNILLIPNASILIDKYLILQSYLYWWIFSVFSNFEKKKYFCGKKPNVYKLTRCEKISWLNAKRIVKINTRRYLLLKTFMRGSAREKRESTCRTSIIKRTSMRAGHLEKEKDRDKGEREKVTCSLLSAHCGFVYDVRFPVLRIHTIITKCQGCICDLLCVTIRKYDTLDNDLRKACALIRCVHTRMEKKIFLSQKTKRSAINNTLKQKCGAQHESVFLYGESDWTWTIDAHESPRTSNVL